MRYGKAEGQIHSRANSSSSIIFFSYSSGNRTSPDFSSSLTMSSVL
ncbi:MAG: hypothetical protein ACW99E_21495 [Promethearchaeota archaeon]